MVSKRMSFRSLIWGGCFLILILDSRTALAGCTQGLELCLKNVIPALFPFLVLSPLFTASVYGESWGWMRPVCRWLRLSPGSTGYLVAGALGGYPVGAQCIRQGVDQGQLDPASARRMLGFCCNCGPGFLFGICASAFSSRWAPWVLWLIHLVSAGIVGRLLPGQISGETGRIAPRNISLTQALIQGVKTMGIICGWVVLFRLVICYGDGLLSRLPAAAAVFLGGMLELTNGCCNLGWIQDEGLRFLVCEMMLSFGGLCVAMQTAGVTGDLGTGWYIPGKGMQCVFSGLLAGMLTCAVRGDFLWAAALGSTLAAFCWLIGRILEKKQKISGNPQLMGV